MPGAPVLAARAAKRAGAGLCVLAVPEPLLVSALSGLRSATGIGLPVGEDRRLIPHMAAERLDAPLARAACVALGPGLGVGGGETQVVLRLVGQTAVPVVVDADAINCLARTPQVLGDLRAACVFTPHPGEFRALAEALQIEADPVDADKRRAAAEIMAQRLGAIVVLKGHRTVVSDGHRAWVCERGHPCLASGGTGDVLTGLIAGLIAQHAAPPEQVAMLARFSRAAAPGLGLFDLACIGVQAHAIAGERWAEAHGASAGLLAEELADLLPAALESLRDS